MPKIRLWSFFLSILRSRIDIQFALKKRTLGATSLRPGLQVCLSSKNDSLGFTIVEEHCCKTNKSCIRFFDEILRRICIIRNESSGSIHDAGDKRILICKFISYNNPSLFDALLPRYLTRGVVLILRLTS
ncbi:hypothetical protein C496_19450 [Natronorubrum tibetense GA33]|uniref:Uncharacterized protein n=1 Tax=Natronorubrum tibetense GA33 TaxID=1114856 RepID=L9VKX2_9EURY|nr:hypothetical protein C496_19450 [Natronorubrum tibetense GA33]